MEPEINEENYFLIQIILDDCSLICDENQISG